MDLENDFFLVVWIRLPILPEWYYSDFLLRATGQTVGLMVKLDVHTDCARKERFEQLACGLYRHGADLCSGVKTTSPKIDSDCVSPMMEKSGIERRVEEEPFGHWMFAALGDFRGENLDDVDGKIDDEMEERNQRQIKGVGGNGVLGLQMTESRSMDTKANKRAKRGNDIC
ncbi:hypothetical protein Gotur_030451 [Gossypium turneri]